MNSLTPYSDPQGGVGLKILKAKGKTTRTLAKAVPQTNVAQRKMWYTYYTISMLISRPPSLNMPSKMASIVWDGSKKNIKSKHGRKHIGSGYGTRVPKSLVRPGGVF